MESKSKQEGIEGVVEQMVFGGNPVRVGYVKGGRVYQPVYGGRDRVIGHVKNGIAYENVFGGEPRPIGKVKYYSRRIVRR